MVTDHAFSFTSADSSLKRLKCNFDTNDNVYKRLMPPKSQFHWHVNQWKNLMEKVYFKKEVVYGCSRENKAGKLFSSTIGYAFKLT